MWGKGSKPTHVKGGYGTSSCSNWWIEKKGIQEKHTVGKTLV